MILHAFKQILADLLDIYSKWSPCIVNSCTASVYVSCVAQLSLTTDHIVHPVKNQSSSLLAVILNRLEYELSGQLSLGLWATHFSPKSKTYQQRAMCFLFEIQMYIHHALLHKCIIKGTNFASVSERKNYMTHWCFHRESGSFTK